MTKFNVEKLLLQRQKYAKPFLQQHTSWVKLTLAGSGFVVPIGKSVDRETKSQELT